MKNQSPGFSLMELMVGMSILSIIGLGLMKLIDNSSKVSNQVKTTDDIMMFRNAINEVFSNPLNCQINLLGKKSGDTVTSHIKAYLNGSVINKFPIGEESSNKVTIESISLGNSSLNGSVGDKSSIDLIVEFNKPVNKSRSGGTRIKKVIPLHASFCQRLWINGVDSNNVLGQCKGANKKLIEGPHSLGATEYWGVCEDCSGSIDQNSQISSCNSLSSGAGVDINNLSKLTCLNMGGTYDENTQACLIDGKSLVNHLDDINEKLCTQEKDLLIQKRKDVNVTLCESSYELKVKSQVFNTPGPKTFTLPAHYAPSSLVIHLLGAGGAGGQGCTYHGEGGKSGQIRKVIAPDSLAAGATLSGVVGAGGAGNENGFGLAGNGHPGGNGGPTSVSINGVTYAASGGAGGRASNQHRQFQNPDGQGVYFLEQFYAGGVYVRNSSGAPGNKGAGGAGGENILFNCYPGGNGGSGIMVFEWVEWREL
jgi:prepilin-type N-terminal cleavage/methylation domain-containing protein